MKPYETREEEDAHIADVYAVQKRNGSIPFSVILAWPCCDRCAGGGYDPQGFGPGEQAGASCRKCGGIGRMRPNIPSHAGLACEHCFATYDRRNDPVNGECNVSPLFFHMAMRDKFGHVIHM